MLLLQAVDLEEHNIQDQESLNSHM